MERDFDMASAQQFVPALWVRKSVMPIIGWTGAYDREHLKIVNAFSRAKILRPVVEVHF